MTATALSPARAKAIANAIAAFDNADEIAAVLARTPDALVSSAASLQTLLDDEAIDADADALFAAIAPHVGVKAPAPLNPMQHVQHCCNKVDCWHWLDGEQAARFVREKNSPS